MKNERRSKQKEGLTNVKKAEDAVKAAKKAKQLAAKLAAAGGEGAAAEAAGAEDPEKEGLQEDGADKADTNADGDEQLDWREYGQEWIGSRVRRAFTGRKNGQRAGSGTITRWVPADESNPVEDPALWHVVHDDGDEEDLEADEVRESFSLLKMHEDEQDSEFEARICEAQQEMRFEPLGLDRHHCRYWLVDSETEFLRGCLVVQRPAGAPAVDDSQCNDNDGESTASEEEAVKSPAPVEEITTATTDAPTDVPLDKADGDDAKHKDGEQKDGECWRSFRKPEHMEHLLSSLNEKGVREYQLQRNMRKRKGEMDTLLAPNKKSNILQAVKHQSGMEYDADEVCGNEDNKVFKMVREALQDAERELKQEQIQTPHDEYHQAYKTFKQEVENAQKPSELQVALNHFCCHVKPSAMEGAWKDFKEDWHQMRDEVNTAGQAGLVLNIFHTMMIGKKAVKLKKKPKQQEEFDGSWCNKGHKWIGSTVRRNYGSHGFGVGTITRWMPADEQNPEEDPALWHVSFDDGDEEDLDEKEVLEALSEFKLKGNKEQPGAKKWKTKGHEWIGASVRVNFGDEGFVDCKVTKWASADKTRKQPVWLVVDEEGAEHLLEKNQMEDALEEFANNEEFGSGKDESEGDDSIQWQHSGHEWLNRCVLRDYGSEGSNQGTITKWVPADPENPEEDIALWHVVFDDGDEEDLDEDEVVESLKLHSAKGRRKRGAPAPAPEEDKKPQRKSSRTKSPENSSDDETDSETESDDEPTVTTSANGRVRSAPRRFKAGPASSTAR